MHKGPLSLAPVGARVRFVRTTRTVDDSHEFAAGEEATKMCTMKTFTSVRCPSLADDQRLPSEATVEWEA